MLNGLGKWLITLMVKISANGPKGKRFPLKTLCKIKLKKENENPELVLEGGHCVNLDVYLTS